jgi:uncharacterized protein YdcH (DUF465 family)
MNDPVTKYNSLDEIINDVQHMLNIKNPEYLSKYDNLEDVRDDLQDIENAIFLMNQEEPFEGYKEIMKLIDELYQIVCTEILINEVE